MSIDHNRIKVADLEKNQPNKTLITNENGELEFSDINDIKIGSYNGLDYSFEGKALDARQGKVLKDLFDDINELLISDNIDLNTIQKLADSIETVQVSLNTILVNDLTTGGATKALSAEMGKLLETNKVDKASGERLINAAEIIKLSAVTTVTTTVKTILSTALSTQNVAGLVMYINALNPVLVVGANEIVKYKISDTGRTFELNLTGRSFGVGQPAILAADVLDVSDFLNKDITFSNYPSSRNDGQLPTDKVLSTDVNGNLKMYRIAMAPAAYLDEIISDSHLPNNTGNFILKGAFFTPSMTVQIVGQTINYITFKSDNEVHVNVTTGINEGNFDVILNNGIESVFPGALLIVLGTVFKPTESDWIDLTNLDVSEIATAKVMNLVFPAYGFWNKEFDMLKNWILRFNVNVSPLVGAGLKGESQISIYDTVTNIEQFQFWPYYNANYFYHNGSLQSVPPLDLDTYFEIKKIGNTIGVTQDNGNRLLYYAASLETFPNNLKLGLNLKTLDLYNIQYIELL